MIDRIRSLFGAAGIRSAGVGRLWRGLRNGKRSDLFLGAAMLALAFFRHNKPSKELIFRKELPVGSAIVVHHTRRGEPKIEVIRP